MSLLMEALKKAEEVKRQAGEGMAAPTATEPPAQTLEPAAAPSGSPLPNLAQHIDALDADLAAVSATSSVKRPPPAGNGTGEQNVARNVFAAKQPPKTGNTLWLIVGAGALAILGVAGYFWWQLQAVQSPGIGRPASPVAAIAPPPPAPAGVSDTTRPAPETPPAAVPPEKLAPSAFAAAPPPPVREPKTPPSPAAAPRQETADTPARLSRTAPRTNTVLERAYDALQAGRTDEAQRGYEQVLRAEGKNTDALLGLATLAAQQGQVERAHAYYLRALESDPSDPTARAGVISTRGQADADVAESRLKTALSSQPNSPSLLFALGNLYARQERWSEAQQTYFQAYAGEPDNPDIIFNLAVSLDHLRQNKLAAQYYQMALSAGGTRKTSFDRDQVKNRLLELQP